MSFNLNNFVNYLDQVKDKDWVDSHVIIDGVSDKFQKEIKDKIRERLKDERLPTTKSIEKNRRRN
jgi:ribosomal silencing factor RsfS|tara:strand:- start:107 stop:301 length:195 start_codon:yes stop_codon:yes gene_type:complete